MRFGLCVASYPQDLYAVPSLILVKNASTLFYILLYWSFEVDGPVRDGGEAAVRIGAM